MRGKVRTVRPFEFYNPGLFWSPFFIYARQSTWGKRSEYINVDEAGSLYKTLCLGESASAVDLL